MKFEFYSNTCLNKGVVYEGFEKDKTSMEVTDVQKYKTIINSVDVMCKIFDVIFWFLIFLILRTKFQAKE